MCRGKRLVADFTAGTDVRPDLPEELQEQLTTTVDGLWVVWAYKLARPAGDLFIPLTGGAGYPADARAECGPRGLRGSLVLGKHDAPHPECTCGFHALSSRRLPGLPAHPHFAVLTVALSGRVLAFEWIGEGLLWRAERQTVVRVEKSGWPEWPTWFESSEEMAALSRRRHPGDPDGRPAVVRPAAPLDSGSMRLSLPASAPPLLPVRHDDAGWCAAARAPRPAPAPLVLA